MEFDISLCTFIANIMNSFNKASSPSGDVSEKQVCQRPAPPATGGSDYDSVVVTDAVALDPNYDLGPIVNSSTLERRHRRIPCGQDPVDPEPSTRWEFYPRDTKRGFLKKMEKSGAHVFPTWDRRSTLSARDQAHDILFDTVLKDLTPGRRAIPLSHPSLSFRVPEDVYPFQEMYDYMKVDHEQFRKNYDVIFNSLNAHQRRYGKLRLFLRLVVELFDLEEEELDFFYPNWHLAEMDQVHVTVPLSLWYHAHEQYGTMGNDDFTAVEFPLRTLMIYSWACKFLDNTSIKSRGRFDQSSDTRPVPFFCLPIEARKQIASQTFVARNLTACPYYVTPNAKDSDEFQLGTLEPRIPESALYMQIDADTTVILPWYARCTLGLQGKTRRISICLGSRGVCNFAFVIFGILGSIKPVDAVTSTGEKAGQQAIYWILFTVLFQLVVTLFPSLNPVKAEKKEDEIPDLEINTPYGFSKYSDSRVKFKQDPQAEEDEDEDIPELEVRPRPEMEEEDDEEEIPQGMPDVGFSDLQLHRYKTKIASIKLQVKARAFSGRLVSNKDHTEDPQMVEAIRIEAASDPTFKDWIVEHASKRHMPMSWVPDEFITSMRVFHSKRRKELEEHFRPSRWRRTMSRYIDTCQAIVKTPATVVGELPIPNSNAILDYATHPVTDLFMLCQRFMFTNWTKDTSAIAKVSIGLDVSVVLLKLWKIIPHSRREWARLAISAAFPGWNWQDADTSNATSAEWIDELAKYDGDFSNARINTKMVILRMIAFGATLPSLWSTFAEKETWTAGILSFCNKHKNGSNISVVMDSMFDMFESACIMCGLGPKSACFDANIKPAEMAYSEVITQLQSVVAGHSEMTLMELESKFNDVLDRYKTLRVHSKGMSQERHVSDRITALGTQITRIHGMMDTGGKHYDTTFFGFSGKQGVGKSTAMECVLALTMALIGETPRVGHILEDDQYDSGLTPYQNCVQIDDVGKTDEKFMKQPAGSVFVRFGTNAATPLLSPIAENKGVNNSHHKVGVVSGNITGMGIHRGMTFWKAAYRRLTEYRMEIVPERSVKVENHWEPIEEYRRAIPEPLNCHFYRVYFDDASADDAVDLRVEKTPKEWPEVVEEIKEKFLAHHRRQLYLLNTSVDRTYCEHDTYKSNCKICSLSKQDAFCRTIANRQVISQFDNLFSGRLESMKKLTHDERVDCKVDNFIMFVVFALFGIISFFVTGAFVSSTFCVLIASRCLIYSILFSFAELAVVYDTLTAEELIDNAKKDKSIGATPILGTLTLASALVMVAAWRNLKPQDSVPATEPLDAQEVPSEPEPTGEQMPDKVVDPEITELVEEMEKYKSGEEPYMTVESQARQRAKAMVVSQVMDNYWNSPIPSKCISVSGSGTTDQHVCDLVATQLWGQIYKFKENGKPMTTRRVVWNIRPDYICMTGHGFDALPDKAVLTYVRGTQKRVLTLDKSSAKRGPPGTDYVFVYVGALSGASQAMLKYLSSNFTTVHGAAGKIVHFDWATQTGKTSSCLLSILPNKTETVSPWDRPMKLKGVINATLEMRSYDGLCGAMYVTNRTVVAMHSFGISGPISFNSSGGSLMSREAVENCFDNVTAFPDLTGPKLDYHSALVRKSEPHPKNPTNYVYMAPIEVFAHVERNATPRSEYRDNPYCEIYEKLLGVKLQGTFVKPKDSFNKIANKMMNMCVSNRGNPPKSLIDKAVSLFLKGAQRILDEAFEAQPMLLRHPMSTHDVINGIIGHPYAHGINEAKSSSFPRYSAKRNMLEGEHPHRVLKPDAARDLADCERKLARGEATGCVGNVLRKDQPMVPGKDDRGFCGCSAEVQILATKIIGPIMHVMQECCHYFCHVIGVDPGSSEWEDFQSRYDVCLEDKFASLDFSAYDLTHPEELKDGFVQVMSAVAGMIGYSKEEVRDVQLICHEMEHMYVNFGGPIVWMNSLWPSGVPPTAQGGSIKTILMLIAGCLEQWGDVEDIRDELVMTALGDDNVFALKKNCTRELDISKLSAFYKASGMHATPDTKTGELTYINRSEVRFLKRETWFHPDLNRRVGKLDMTSLTRPLVLCKKNQPMHQIMVDLVNSSAREASLYGRNFYNLLMEAHREVFAREEWARPAVMEITYDDYIEILIDRNDSKYRRALKTQDEDDAIATDETGVREIVETEPIVEEEGDLATYRDPTTNRTMSGDKQLPDYIQREVFVSTTTVTRNVFLSLSFNPLTEIMSTPGIRSRFGTYHAFAFDIVVRFAVSGTKFDYGRFIVSYMYNPPVLDFQNEKSLPLNTQVRLMSQRQNVCFDIGKDEEAEITIPFFYHHAMMPLNDVNFADYVDVRLVSVTPPRSGMEDTSGNPTISTYARLANVTAMGHTTASLQDGVLTPNESASKPSVVLAKIARAAAAVGMWFPGMQTVSEVVAGAAGGASGIARAFGYSTPMEVGGKPYVSFASAPTANANVDRAGRVLSLDVHQGVSMHPNIGGTGNTDPLTIEGLANRPFIMQVASIPAFSNGISSPWFTCNITPAIAIQNLSRWFIPPCGLVSLFRKHWHGTMCYKIDILATGLTGGKLIVTYNANGNSPATLDTHTLENVVWDLKATHSITLKFEWHQYRNWLQTFDEGLLSNPIGTPYDDGRFNGSFSIATLQPIVGTKPNTTVDYVVTAWMENARFGNPNYEAMSSHRVFNLPNIPTGDPNADTPDNSGPGGLVGLLQDRILNNITGDDLRDGVVGRRPITGIMGLFAQPISRRRRRRILRQVGLLSLGQAVTPAPTPPPAPDPTDAPSASQPAPTTFPTFEPTAVPTVTATTTAPTRLPTTASPTSAPILSTLFPTGMITQQPTNAATVANCEVYVAQADPEMLGASDLFRENGQWKTSGTTMSVRSTAFSSETEPAEIVVLTDVAPSSLPDGATAIPGGFRITGPVSQGLSSYNRTVQFPSQATVLGVTITMPGGSGIREYTPNDLAGIYGYATDTEVVDGEVLEYALIPGGTVFTPPATTLPSECGINPNSFVTMVYDGTLDGPSEPARTASFGSRRWAGNPLTMEAVAPTKVYAMYIVETGPGFQGEVTASETDFIKVFGAPQPLHDDIVALHMGEDLLSLRQDLKVLREVGEFVVTPAEVEGNYQAHLHASPSGLLGPYELLLTCFAGIRGGMTAWYRLHGDGYAKIQRGQKFFTTTGEIDADLQRGFEYIDTRTNPTMIVSFPWLSQSRFEYARYAFAGTELNIRNVEATNTGSTDLTVVESLSIKEDFDLLRFMGCPLLV